MTNRIKVAPNAITRNRAEELVGEVATLTLERNSQKLEMDRLITEIRERYEHSLCNLGKAIDEKTALLESWAAANADEFPKGLKSIDMVQGRIGYRTGTPKLKALARKTWESILEVIKAVGRTDLVRTKEEVAKDVILAQYASGELDAKALKAMNLQVVQDETFFVEPKLQELENRVTAAA